MQNAQLMLARAEHEKLRIERQVQHLSVALIRLLFGVVTIEKSTHEYCSTSIALQADLVLTTLKYRFETRYSLGAKFAKYCGHRPTDRLATKACQRACVHRVSKPQHTGPSVVTSCGISHHRRTLVQSDHRGWRYHVAELYTLTQTLACVHSRNNTGQCSLSH